MSELINTRDYVYAIAPSPDFACDGICFVARASGLFRFDTGTLGWLSSYASLNLPDALVTPATVVSPSFATDRTVYAGTNGGVLRSEDGGATWVLGNMPRPAPVISAMVLSPDFAKDGVAFAGTMEDGLLRSPDRGTQWHRWNFGLLDLHVLCLAISPRFATDGNLLIGTDTGVFRSINGGRSWRQVGFPGDLAPVLCMALSPAFPDVSTVYAGTEANGLFVSRDGGDHWEQVGGEALPDVVNAIVVARPVPHETPAVQILATTDERVLVSHSDGDRWFEVPCALSPDDAISAVAAPYGLGSGAPLLVGTSSGQVVQIRIA